MDTLAMHISNGIVDPATSAVFAAIALAGMIACVLRGRRDLDDRLAPMAGLVAAFIFAVQMLNFPVLPGVSGHLLGGALAAMLVGPWVGALCVAIVLIVQALVFADGGVSAIGLNITNMALIGTFLTYGVLALLLKVLPKTATGVAITGFAAAVVSVVAGSLGFVLQYAIGGEVDGVSLGAAAGAMVGVHALIGVGEGVITAVTVLAVAKVRPDLVYALHGRRITSPSATTVESAA
ncbi:energy-coupling factor ABC transporter permease [Phytomonospora sp. NPDC050363]|uniref:energy-coupling factor ABC transporter permease n=1 Tax=Phytomonospora sp. NPDC050363 TaxID=3155642 RepID=UPI0033FD4567